MQRLASAGAVGGAAAVSPPVPAVHLALPPCFLCTVLIPALEPSMRRPLPALLLASTLLTGLVACSADEPTRGANAHASGEASRGTGRMA